MATKRSVGDLWASIHRGAPDKCWPWLRGTDRFGHGQLTVDGATKKAHRLAYELHYGVFDAALCVLHRCDNPPCCNPAHLFLGTRGDNNRDRHAKGRNAKHRDLPTGEDHWSARHPEKIQRGEDHAMARLTEPEVIEIRNLAVTDVATGDLAVRFGVTVAMIHRIATGQAWTHVGGPIRVQTPRAKLTDDDVRAIRAAFASGEPRTPLAAQYGIRYGTITAIVLRRTWKHVA